MSEEIVPPVVAAVTPPAVDTTLLSPPVEKVVEGDKNADGTPKVAAVVDPLKNADGSAKTADQIAADKVVSDKAAADKLVADKAAEDKKTADAKTARAATAPEKYEAYKLPEGITLSTEDTTAFNELAKSEGLTQDAAQKFVDMATKNAAANATAVAKQWTDTRTAWKAEIEKDPVVGGANFNTSKEHAIRAVASFVKDDPSLAAVLNTGWGDNPALFKVFAKIGKTMSEDKVVEGSKSNTTAPKTYASVMYPNQTKPA